MKKNILLPIIAASTLAATVVPSITGCSCGAYSKMEVEELTKSKEISGDSDKESIVYKFKQKNTENYSATKATLVNFKVHNKDEEVKFGLLDTKTNSDGTVNVTFNTQFFIQEYLSKYYNSDTNDVIPTTYEIQLTNEEDKTTYVSTGYKLSITPAEYLVTCVSHSQYLTLPADSNVKVYKEYSNTYTIDEKYKISNRSILRYDGEELYGKTGVIFDNNQIYIPAEYVTGPIVITADADEIICNVYGLGTNVTYTLPTYVAPKTKITGTFTITAGSEFDEENSGVYVNGEWLTTGYEIKYSAGTGTISVDAQYVTDDVYIYVAVTDPVEYSVTTKSQDDKVTFTDVPKTIAKLTTITGKYAINDSSYEFDSSTSFVSVNGVKLESGYSFSNGNIVVNGPFVTGNVVIYIGVKKLATVPVVATGDYYVVFPEPPKAYVGKQYKLTYKEQYGSLKTISVSTTKSGELVRDTDYTCSNGVITINANKIVDGDSITITATGNPKNYSFTPDFDDRISVVSYTTPINYMKDFHCTIKLEFEYGTVTGWGCAVDGDERYTQWLEYDSSTKTFTLPGKYVKGNIKIWASLA